MEIYNERQYRIYNHYVATIIECNQAIVTPIVKELKVIGYEIKPAITPHETLSIDYFVNTKSKQLGEGNLIDEWLWKYPNIL